MGTQTQNQNRQQQGDDKKTPPQHQQPPHDPIVDPDRDDGKRIERNADKNRQGQRADDEDTTDQPAKGEVTDDDEDEDEDDEAENDEAKEGSQDRNR